MIDITKTGPVGLKGLKSVLSNRANSVPLNNTQQLIENAASQIPGNHMNARQVQAAFTPAPIEHHGIELGEKGVGLSSYDNNMKNRAQADDLNDYRFSSQSGLMQLTNGVIKAGTTALTTFLDGTLGSLYGLGQGIYNMFDKDSNTSFLDGLWNNDFNKAMQSAQSDAEKILPNYYSNQQMNSSWYSAANLLSANFLGDKIIKNAGFTIGTLATMAIPGFNGAWVAKAVDGLGNIFNGARAAKVISGASKVANRIARTLVSAHSEAAVEAINAVNSDQQLMYKNLDNRRNQSITTLRNEYASDVKNGMDSNTAMQKYKSGLNSIQNSYNEAKKQTDEYMVNAGNSVYGLNMVLLGIDNNLEFSKYLKGGFNLQKGARLYEPLISGKPVKDMEQFGKAMAKGTASLKNDMIAPGSARGIVRAVAGTLGHGVEEGYEEGAQDMISDTNQLVAQAKLNQWANQKYRTDKDRYSLFASRINPDVSEDLANYSKAMMQTWQNDFGTFSNSGWQDVMLGAVTGLAGTLGVINGKKGKLKIGWQGGLVDELRDVSNNYAGNQLIIDEMNKRMSDPKFVENTRHTIAALTFANDMNEALQNNDIKMFKNAELMSTLNNALHFKNSGLSDAFTAFYKEAAAGITKNDIDAVRTQMRKYGTDKSYFDTMSDDELKERLQDKASSTLDKINSAVTNYDALNIKYKDAFDKIDPRYSQAAVEQLVSLKTLYDDMKRRKSELQTQKSNDDITSASDYDKQIDSLQDSMDNLKDDYDYYIENPKSLVSELNDIMVRAKKAETFKDDSKAMDSYNTASTLKDAYETYFYNKKPEVLDKAIKRATGKNKDLLVNLKSFNSELNATRTAVSDVVDDYFKTPDSDEQELDSFKGFIGETIIDPVIEELTNDPNNAYTKELLSDALKKRVNSIAKDSSEGRMLTHIIEEVADRIKEVSTVNDSTGNEDFKSTNDEDSESANDIVSIIPDEDEEKNTDTKTTEPVTSEKPETKGTKETQETPKELSPAEIKDEDDWAAARKEDTSKAYQKYIEDHPNGITRKAADKFLKLRLKQEKRKETKRVKPSNKELDLPFGETVSKPSNKPESKPVNKQGTTKKITPKKSEETEKSVETENTKESENKTVEVPDEGVTHIYNGSDYVGTINEDKSFTLTRDDKSKYFNVVNDTKVSGKSKKVRKTTPKKEVVNKEEYAEQEIPFTENLENPIVTYRKKSNNTNKENEQYEEEQKKKLEKVKKHAPAIIKKKFPSIKMNSNGYSEVIQTVTYKSGKKVDFAWHIKKVDSTVIELEVVRKLHDSSDDNYTPITTYHLPVPDELRDDDENMDILSEDSAHTIGIENLVYVYNKRPKIDPDVIARSVVAYPDTGPVKNTFKYSFKKDNDSVIPDTGKQQSENNVVTIDDTEAESNTPLPNSSYRANAYQQYEEDIKNTGSKNKGVARERKADTAKEFREFLNKEHIDIDYIINYKLNALRDKDEKLKVHYMSIEGRPNDVFLVIPYTDNVKKVIPTGSYGANNIKHTSKGDYLIVGVLGYYYTPGNEALKEGHNHIKEQLAKEKNSSNDTNRFFVGDSETNSIYDVAPGSVVRKYENEEKTTDSDVSKLLQDKKSNPYNLTPKGLTWGIVEGDSDGLYMKYINADKKVIVAPKEKKYAGKVYLFIPDGAGHYVPLYITPKVYNDNFDHSYIEKTVKDIINSTNDVERAKNINILRSQLLFSYGNNIYFNNDPKASDYNTIKYRIANTAQEGFIDFRDSSTQTKEEQEKLLNSMLSAINPRINISTSILAKKPEIYLNSGLITTGTRVLGTVNTQAYLYPIDKNGKPIESFHAVSQDNEVTVKQRATTTLYVNNSIVYYDGKNYYDKNKNIITDDTLLNQIKDINEIQRGKANVVKVHNYNYWEINGRVYYKDKSGNFMILTGTRLDDYNKLVETMNADKQRQNNINREPVINETAKDLFVVPETDENTPEEKQQEESKTAKEKTVTPVKTTINLNGHSQNNRNTKNNLDIKANSSNFETVYKKVSMQKKKSLKDSIELATGTKVKNAKQVREIVSKSNKEASGLLNNITNEGDFDRLIEAINKCGL